MLSRSNSASAVARSLQAGASPSPSIIVSSIKSKDKGKVKEIFRTPEPESEDSSSESSDSGEEDGSSEVDVFDSSTIVVRPPQPVRANSPPSKMVTRNQGRQLKRGSKSVPPGRSRGRSPVRSPLPSASAPKKAPKTPVSRKKSGNSTSSVHIRTRASMEEVIPSLEEEPLRILVADYDKDIVSLSFTTLVQSLFCLISFLILFIKPPVLMCHNCIAHQNEDCGFQGWGNRCNRCASGRRPGCTFTLTPGQRTRTRELFAASTHNSLQGSFFLCLC